MGTLEDIPNPVSTLLRSDKKVASMESESFADVL